MKYESETGESMEKPGKKLKKLLIITGTTGAVYAGFKYLLPLVAPFFVGYVFALLLRPSARFLAYRMHITVKGKRIHMPIGVIGGIEFLALVSILGTGFYLGAVKLCAEGKMFMTRLPVWLDRFDIWLTGSCHRVESAFGLRYDSVADLAGDMLFNLINTGKTAAMPFLMTNSLTILSGLVKGAIIGLVVFLAAILSLQEMEDIRVRRDQSTFRKEFNLIGGRLVQTGKAWFKSQGIILFVTIGLCIAGMFLIGNPYYIMAGIGIGILDALPIFGTGTVLIPWGVLKLVTGDWKQAAILTGLYLVCYFVREILEVRMMGGQVGLSPLETLAAVYVGLELFGFFGFILGPLGLLLVEDLVEVWTKEQEHGQLGIEPGEEGS